MESLPTTGGRALLRGVHELVFAADPGGAHPFYGLEFVVSLARPDGRVAAAEGFYDGGTTFRARAYTDTPGDWTWTTRSNVPALDGQAGSFHVAPSDLPGKLRIHPDDPYQFAFDDGSWFLHLGDTGYRYVASSEPLWQAYIDQAAEMGATKIRTWFCEGRNDVQVLLTDDRAGMNLPYWQEIDRRIAYAAARYPRMNFQLIPYGEDTDELRRYDSGDQACLAIGRYSQARLSAFPNVSWCVSNDRAIVDDDPSQPLELGKRQVRRSTIDAIARDMRAREPWGTLLTNHQKRFTGFSFCGRDWCDVVILEDLDQIDGRLILEYRDRARCPIVNDEDRYETYRPPAAPRYFFRRLTWASLLSGGHATYGGLRTFEPYDGTTRGMHGYFDACRDGRLQQGAHDYRHVQAFFAQTQLTLVGMRPDDAAVGGDPTRAKCIRDENTILVYVANPAVENPEISPAAVEPTTVTVDAPVETWSADWFNPSSGAFQPAEPTPDAPQTFPTPAGGDWVLLLRRR